MAKKRYMTLRNPRRRRPPIKPEVMIAKLQGIQKVIKGMAQKDAYRLLMAAADLVDG